MLFPPLRQQTFRPRSKTVIIGVTSSLVAYYTSKNNLQRHIKTHKDIMETQNTEVAAQYYRSDTLTIYQLYTSFLESTQRQNINFKCKCNLCKCDIN